MKRLAATLVAVLLLTACGGNDRDERGTITAHVDGRRFLLHIPDSYVEGRPLVVLLHGFTSSAAEQESYFKLTAESDARGFLYAMPDGTEDADGNRFWNADPACCDFYRTGVDDVAFLHGLVETVKERHPVRQVYFVGHSNGGFMAYRMACEHPEEVTAVVSLAGAANGCVTTNPVSVLHIHGTDDQVIAYDGGANNGQTYPSALGTLAVWRRNDRCDIPATEGRALDLDGDVPGAETRVTTYACAANSTVTFWSIASGGHVPGLTAEFPKAVSDWLEL